VVCLWHQLAASEVASRALQESQSQLLVMHHKLRKERVRVVQLQEEKVGARPSSARVYSTAQGRSDRRKVDLLHA
jgi:hypothetical protein